MKARCKPTFLNLVVPKLAHDSVKSNTYEPGAKLFNCFLPLIIVKQVTLNSTRTRNIPHQICRTSQPRQHHASRGRGSIDHTTAKKNEHFTHLYLPLSSRFCAVNRRVILCLSDESTWKQSCVSIILKQEFSSRKYLITGLCKLKEVTRWPEKSDKKAARERASRDIRVTSPPNHLATN